MNAIFQEQVLWSGAGHHRVQVIDRHAQASGYCHRDLVVPQNIFIPAKKRAVRVIFDLA